MTWNFNTLRAEILEQFADPRWSGMQLQKPAHFCDDAASGEAQKAIPDSLYVVHENDNWNTVTRRTDKDFADRVREVASTRFTWRGEDLAEELGERSRSVACAAGKVLARSPGWVRSNLHTWTNKTAVLAWCATQTDLTIVPASKHTGVSRVVLGMWLREDGWTTKSGSKINVWNKPEAA